MIRKTLCFFLLILCTVRSGAGQDGILSQFFSIPLYINPAFSGSHKGYHGVLSVRSHPLLDATNLSAYNISADGFFPSLYGGIGLIASSNYQGNLVWTNNISAVYAYHLQFQQNWFANFGVQAGYYGRDYRWSDLEFLELGQQPPASLWKHSPDFAAGLIVYNRLIYAGTALHHLSRPIIGLFDDIRLHRKFTAHAGAWFERDFFTEAGYQQYFISPNIIYQQQGPFQRINYGLYAGVASVMAGMWFRQDLQNSNTLIFLAGLRLGNLSLGYSYDHSLSGFTNAWHGIHEISISWFQARDRKRHQPIPCPRF